MKRTIAILVLLLFALPPTVMAQDQWIHLRVSEGEAGERFNLNLPLTTISALLPSLAEKGLKAGDINISHGDMNVEDLRAMWNSLRNQGDFQIAEIEEDGMHLQVAMEGDNLVARSVEGAEKQINVQIPAILVDALLSGEGDQLSIQAAVEALAQLGSTDIVKVSDGKKNIELWIDASSSGN